MLQKIIITAANKIITTVSPGMFSEVRSFFCKGKEEDYENLA